MGGPGDQDVGCVRDLARLVSATTLVATWRIHEIYAERP